MELGPHAYTHDHSSATLIMIYTLHNNGYRRRRIGHQGGGYGDCDQDSKVFLMSPGMLHGSLVMKEHSK